MCLLAIIVRLNCWPGWDPEGIESGEALGVGETQFCDVSATCESGQLNQAISEEERLPAMPGGRSAKESILRFHVTILLES
jgi:hypothetical protein